MKCSVTPKITARITNRIIGFGIWVPPMLPKPQLVNCVREVGHGLVAEDDVGEAAVERERADGDGERRQPEAGDQHAVERAGQPAERRSRRG